MIIEAVSRPEMSAYFHETTRRYNPGSCHLYTRRRENLKTHMNRVGFITINTNTTHRSKCNLRSPGCSLFVWSLNPLGAGVARSVQCLVTDWTTGRSRFDPRQRQKDSSSSFCVQTGSGAHPVSSLMGTGGAFGTG
jgi:hypothetical protein